MVLFFIIPLFFLRKQNRRGLFPLPLEMFKAKNSARLFVSFPTQKTRADNDSPFFFLSSPGTEGRRRFPSPVCAVPPGPLVMHSPFLKKGAFSTPLSSFLSS